MSVTPYADMCEVRRPCNKWAEVVRSADAQHRDGPWMFRGHAKSNWVLTSRLERALEERFELGLSRAPEFEDRLLREFKRHFHRFTAAQDDIEVLALMRHSGAPTRFLDWTYSFWVAVYFALESASVGSVCSIWGI